MSPLQNTPDTAEIQAFTRDEITQAGGVSQVGSRHLYLDDLALVWSAETGLVAKMGGGEPSPAMVEKLRERLAVSSNGQTSFDMQAALKARLEELEAATRPPRIAGEEPAIDEISYRNGQYAANATVMSIAAKTQSQATQAVYVPELPEAARLPGIDTSDACPWLDVYTAVSRQFSPRGYDGFHEAMGLWVLSTVAARRLKVQLGQEPFYTNLSIAFVAFTTIYAKSTTARIGQRLLRDAGLDYLLAPDDSTPQAFLAGMQAKLPTNYGELSPEQQAQEIRRRKFPAQRGWFFDEFGMKVQAIMRENGTMADFRGLLRVLDDGLDRYVYETISRGRNVIDHPYLALLASLTPADIKPYAGANAPLWRDGFWARIALISPPPGHKPDKGRFPSHEMDFPGELVDTLKTWHKSLGVPKVEATAVGDKGYFELDREPLPCHSMQLETAVIDAFYAYHDGLLDIALNQAESGNADLVGNYGRFAEKAMRVAMLLASVSGHNRIGLVHWAKAQEITERWRASLHNLAGWVNQPEPSEEKQLQEKVIEILATKLDGQGTANEIGRYIRHLSGPEVDSICIKLLQAKVLKVEKTRVGTNRYSPT